MTTKKQANSGAEKFTRGILQADVIRQKKEISQLEDRSFEIIYSEKQKEE